MDSSIRAQQRYERARKRVEALKGFYGHLQAFIMVNLVLIAGRYLVPYFLELPDLGAEGWRWVDINIWLTPLIWGIALAIHALVVFRYKMSFLKEWEERKIRRIMEEEELSSKDRWT